ncbi:type IV pilus assembly protein PilM [Abditibacterium utsteinense]|uniref:Type IV pilus assembly protein PilM n=1 Tax=Abditibacterium utsteinense TaxID=1960156 RepID=A0A2S8SVT6_9BACT|nr:type IV pilus assembly protein PilM [Abditibacterium utsteinense]PQV64909.1 type IV pilus assembly protein PilM [Abditibacterium utsteinense]
MALFGKKVKDGASALPVTTPTGDDFGAGGVAVQTLEAPTAKAARAPKATKGKTLKNGVAVGLNIGNQFIKAVEVTSKNGELAVTAMGAVPTPAESYTNGNVLSVSALSGAIKDLWRGAGIKSKVAITSVAGTGALVVRVIEVPRMSDGELGDNMKVDADRYIPFPPSEVVMDFKALRELPTDPDAPNMEVLLAAAQREIIDLHVQVVQKAKLDPRAIDVEPIAAARAMQLERRGESAFIDYNEITAIVNLGATGTEISILRGDILVFTRVVPGGGNLITQAIAEGLGLPFADAERVKIESADAQAPAGYGTGNSGGFGTENGDDFNFGGDEFGGVGDLNTAFDDISANPTAATSDDPFDLDFFNQGPKDEPGAGHAQKEGEPEEAPAFNFSGFDFDAPATGSASPQTPSPTQSSPAVDTPSDAGAMGFNFGFDELSKDDLPSATPEVTGAAPTATEKRTAQLEDLAAGDLATPTPLPASGSSFLGGDFAMPSAFDFDNFDLPAVAPETSSTFSPALEATPQTISGTPVSADFGLAVPVEIAPAATAPKDSGSANEGFAFQPAPETTTSETAAAVPTNVAPTSFDFALSEPIATEPPPAFSPIDSMEEVPDTVVASPSPAPADEFDLDAIFGSSPAEPETGQVASPAINLEKESDIQPDDEINFAEDVSAAPVAMNDNDFGLGDINSPAGDDFAAGFDPANDFSTFGAGLGAGGAGADAAALYGLVYPSLEELAGEVRRSLEFHLGRYPDATISRLVLVGGGARLRNLDVFLTQSLGVPTTVANPFAHLTVQTPKLAPGYAVENGPLCAVALGLALRDFVD